MDATGFLDLQDAFVYLFGPSVAWLLVFILALGVLLAAAIVAVSIVRRVDKSD